MMFHKLPECDRCQFFAGSPHLACTVHPFGVERDRCPDHQPHPDWEEFSRLDWVAEEWEPDGASYYNGELILTPEQQLTLDQRFALLDWHPLFTGRCPECERAIAPTVPPQVHLDCPHCHWKDDSI